MRKNKMASGYAVLAAWYWRITGESGFLPRSSPYMARSEESLHHAEAGHIEHHQALRSRVDDSQLLETRHEAERPRKHESGGGNGHRPRFQAAHLEKREVHIALHTRYGPRQAGAGITGIAGISSTGIDGEGCPGAGAQWIFRVPHDEAKLR